jgi:hypothetical protein
MDYTYTKVNQHSLDLAPFQAMQFGNTLQRVINAWHMPTQHLAHHY